MSHSLLIQQKKAIFALKRNFASQKYTIPSDQSLSETIDRSVFFKTRDGKKLSLRKIQHLRKWQKKCRVQLACDDEWLNKRKKSTYREAENRDNTVSSLTIGIKTLTAGPPMSAYCFKSIYESWLLRHILSRTG